ncbi:MAG: glycosyltransferase family 1 protein [Lachnospiraceae bacterium]|nr:glycosyltransferase family 1 protein [Lachnospiraceae bacterium]
MKAEERGAAENAAEYLAAKGKHLASVLKDPGSAKAPLNVRTRKPSGNGKIRVLQVIGGLSVGGAESRIMDILRLLDREHFQYDFLLNEAPGFYEEEAKALGCHVYRTVKYRFYNRARYEREMREFFATHPGIDIVQGHSTNTAALYLPIAKAAGVPVTIAHARSAGVDPGIKGALVKLTRRGLAKKTDYCWACSGEAAEAVFGAEAAKAGRVRLIPNAVDLDRFAPLKEHLEAGEDLRRTMKLGDKLVVGHVGRFHYAKNHEFLLECFAEIRKKRDAVLMLVGEGELEAQIREKARALGIEKSVIFTGRQGEPAPYYQAMDVLVFPSRYEGLPGTIVESQASGLPALVSESVTKDVKVTELAEYLPLTKSPTAWAEEALKLADRYPRTKRAELSRCTEQLKKAGFDVKSQVRMLEQLYREMLDAKDR